MALKPYISPAVTAPSFLCTALKHIELAALVHIRWRWPAQDPTEIIEMRLRGRSLFELGAFPTAKQILGGVRDGVIRSSFIVFFYSWSNSTLQWAGYQPCYTKSKTPALPGSARVSIASYLGRSAPLHLEYITLLKQRGDNEGQIRKRPDGRWEARIRLPDGTRKSFYAKTRNEVARKLRTFQSRMDKGLLAEKHKVLLGDYLGDWLEVSVRPTVRPRTHKRYSELVRLHIKPYLGRVSLATFNPQQAQHWINALVETDLSPATIHRTRGVLRRALNVAIQWELVDRNVAHDGRYAEGKNESASSR